MSSIGADGKINSSGDTADSDGVKTFPTAHKGAIESGSMGISSRRGGQLVRRLLVGTRLAVGMVLGKGLGVARI